MSTRGRLLAAVTGAAAVAAASLAAGRSVRRVTVSGRSMEPALLPGDRVLVVSGRGHGGRGLRRGDVVMFREPGGAGLLAVKRVAALPGEPAVTAEGESVPGGPGYALIGDNRAASVDSRRYGRVEGADIVGRAAYRYAPGARRGRL